VLEPNISPWRRAVCGDLTSTLDLGNADADAFYDALPNTIELATRARALPGTTTPPTPASPDLPVQDTGVRRSRALPYRLHVHAKVHARSELVELTFVSAGAGAAVFHVYDKRHLDRPPRRYTVDAGRHLRGTWDVSADAGAYDLWLLGPNGFHRHLTGNTRALLEHRAVQPEAQLGYERGELLILLRNAGPRACRFELTPNAYAWGGHRTLSVGPHAELEHRVSLRQSGHWYDFTVEVDHLGGYARRFAGRVETGRDSISDPAMGGPALGDR
jgi:phospholipase C